MPELFLLFNAHRDAFMSELTAAPDVKAACDALTHQLGAIRHEYLAQTINPHVRAVFNALMGTATSALASMVSVSQIEFSVRLPSGNNSTIAKRNAHGWRYYLGFLPSSLCAVLALLLFGDGKIPAMILAIIAALASVVTMPKKVAPSKQLPDVSGITRVDSAELLRRVERLTQDIDVWMEQLDIQSEQPLELTQPLMESIQMLMEARLTEDGAFALRALPSMMSALSTQGIDVLMYDENNMRDFDLLPAPIGGETIRPALMKDGKLLSRGQATAKG